MKWHRIETGYIADFKGDFKCEISSTQTRSYKNHSAQVWKLEVKHVWTGQMVSCRLRGLPFCKEAAEAIVGAWLKGIEDGRNNL